MHYSHSCFLSRDKTTYIGNANWDLLTWTMCNLVFAGVANPGSDEDLCHFSPGRTGGAK